MDSRQIEILKATVQALVNDQAFLYALVCQADVPSEDRTIEMFEQWQDEWKRETAHNIRVLLGETDETSSNSS